MSEVLSERGKKFIDHFPIINLTGNYDAQVNFHIDIKTDAVWKELQEMFKRNGMKTTPHAGIFVINISKMVADAFFKDANSLGINPMEYSKDRLINILNTVEKVDTGIEKVVKVRDNTIKRIDNKNTLKLQAMVAGK
jgi:phosphosulfolactate synthase (CoM biosynthesis protein A)